MCERAPKEEQRAGETNINNEKIRTDWGRVKAANVDTRFREKLFPNFIGKRSYM